MEKEGAPKSQDDRTHHSEHKNSIHLNTDLLTKILKLSQPYSQAIIHLISFLVEQGDQILCPN